MVEISCMFFCQKNTYVDVAVYNGCLLVLLACATQFKSIRICSTSLFLTVLFVCFLLLFLLILLISIVHDLLCCRIFTPKVPRSDQFSHAFVCFFLAFRRWGISAACCLASSVFVFSFPFFFELF